MSGSGFLILFALSCILFPCEGGIISPADGTNFIFLPGTTAKVTWIFDDAISSVFCRTWFFTRRGGSRSERLAVITGDSYPVVRKNILPGVEIVKPGTLLLRNVNQSYNGMYKFRFSLTSGPTLESVVTVFIAIKPKDTSIEFTQNPAKLGTSVTIKCKSRGFPEPSYIITLNGAKTVSTEKMYTISMVGWNDAGTYNCTATNERGSDWAADFLDVTEQGPSTPATATSTPATATSTPATSTLKTSNKITTTD